MKKAGKRKTAPCDACNGSGIRPDSTPHAGDLPRGYIAVERCDACGRYRDDTTAALAFGGKDHRVRGSARGSDVICKPPKGWEKRYLLPGLHMSPPPQARRPTTAVEAGL